MLTVSASTGGGGLPPDVVYLADALGVNYQTIGYLERGEYNPSLDLALRTAEFFALPVEAIFSRRPFAPMSAQLYAQP